MRQTLRFDDGAQVELLHFGLESLPDRDRLACLAPEELARAERFHFPVHRRRYLAAHCALREALGAATGRPPADLRFVAGRLGKPRLADSAAWHFNLAHSGDLALLAVSNDAEVGVDVELLRPLDDAEALARANHSADECAALRALPRSERDSGFLRLWTRKEACLKAIGTGLAVHPASFSVGLDGGETHVRIVWPQGDALLALCSVDAGPQALAALALGRGE